MMTITDKTKAALEVIARAKPGIFVRYNSLADWLHTTTGYEWARQQVKDLLQDHKETNRIISECAKQDSHIGRYDKIKEIRYNNMCIARSNKHPSNVKR